MKLSLDVGLCLSNESSTSYGAKFAAVNGLVAGMITRNTAARTIATAGGSEVGYASSLGQADCANPLGQAASADVARASRVGTSVAHGYSRCMERGKISPRRKW